MLEQNLRKETHFKIKFYYLYMITLPLWTILLFGNGIGGVVVLLLHISTL